MKTLILVDLKAQLGDRNLKWNWDKIADYVVAHPHLLPKLVEFSLDGELEIKKNAAAVLGKICDKDKNLLRPFLLSLAKNLENNPIDAVKRSTVRIFQFCEIPEEVEGYLFDQMVIYLKSSEEAIAIKAFGMTVARKICQNYPELTSELLPRLEILLEEKVSAGITARARREIKILRKLQL